MEESGYRFGVGVLVMASAIIGVLLIAFFGAVPTLWVDRNRVSINFPRAPRVTVDTPVRKNGVLIGRVSSISLRPGSEGVIIRMELDRKVELKKGEVPRIVSGSIITGDAVIEFLEPTNESNLRRFDGTMGTPRDGVLDARETAAINEIITDNSFLDGGEVASDPLESLARVEQNILPMFATMERAMTTFESIGGSVKNVIGEENGPIRDLVATFKSTAENVNKAVNSLDRVAIQIENAQIPNAIANGLAVLPDLFGEFKATLAQAQRTLKGFEQFSASLEGLGKEFDGIGQTIRIAVENANDAIENIAKITEPVSENREVLVANAVNALKNLTVLSEDLKKFTNRLNNSKGTIAQLVDDQQLGLAVNKSVQNIQSVSGQIEFLTQNLNRKLPAILDDARIFTNKVSRTPEVLVDLKGTLSNRPRGIGTR